MNPKAVLFSASAAALAGVIWKAQPGPAAINFLLCMAGFFICLGCIPEVTELFAAAGCTGKDLNKPNQPIIPESLGVVVGAVYMMCMFLFIPFSFVTHALVTGDDEFPHTRFSEFLAALLSICCMILLGFADDVLNLKWRYKLILPTLASLPLLMVYYVNISSTTIALPRQVRELFGSDTIDIGFLYYVYMGMLAVFCTNAINILAGVNGLESGQSLVIGASILVNNAVQLGGPQHEQHLFSMYMMGPFVAVTAALFYHNWYPSSVFVGDTFCYFSGMTFAVVGIIGHFSKTVLLFFIPQILNFLYSCPQLFRLIPCPRHRMPRLNPKTGRLECSVVVFKLSELKAPGKLLYHIIATFRLAQISTKKLKSGDTEVTMSNLTLINFTLHALGSMREDRLCTALLLLQVACSVLAFFIRYRAVFLVYDHN